MHQERVSQRAPTRRTGIGGTFSFWRVGMADGKRDNPKAEEAFLDYAEMGPGRSLESLAHMYQTRTNPAPTKHLTTLKQWSVRYQWRARLASATSALTEARLTEAAELDADTFLRTSILLNDGAKHVLPIETDRIVKLRESVRKPMPKGGVVDVVHSGTVKHAHHDMSTFSEDEIDALAAIAERKKAGVA